MDVLKKNWLFFKNGFKKMKDDIFSLEKERVQKQIPNMLTLSRGTLAPLCILPFALTGNLLTAGIFTGIFALTDFFDGKIARKYNAYSDFGKELDPICDKIFAISLILPLITIFPTHIIPILLFEGIISTVNAFSKLKGNDPKTKIIGKVKTFALSITMVLGYISTLNPALFMIMDKIFYSTIALQFASSIEYISSDMKKDAKKINKALLEKNTIDQFNENQKLKEELLQYKKELNNVRTENNYYGYIHETTKVEKPKVLVLKKED